MSRIPTEVEFFEAFMRKQKLEFFRTDQLPAVENGKLPLAVEHFDKYGPFITQAEFWLSYANEHEAFLAAFADTAEMVQAVKARIYRLYPSLMREHHAYLLFRDRGGFAWVERNRRLDLAGVDLLIVAATQAFGVHLYIDSVESNYYRARKDRRYKQIGHTVELALNLKAAQSVGPFKVYGQEHLTQLQEAINAVG